MPRLNNFIGYGYGYGYGYGSGSGYGDGSGSGSGDGYPEQEIGGARAVVAGFVARESVELADAAFGDLLELATNGVGAP